MIYLLDTNVCVGVLKGQANVCAHLAAVRPADCALSTVTAYELLTGVGRCSQPDRELKKLGRFFAVISVLPFDLLAAGEAARVRDELERAGQKIGPYDLLIAGHALALDLQLVTHNTREFTRIGFLKLLDWRS